MFGLVSKALYEEAIAEVVKERRQRLELEKTVTKMVDHVSEQYTQNAQFLSLLTETHDLVRDRDAEMLSLTHLFSDPTVELLMQECDTLLVFLRQTVTLTAQLMELTGEIVEKDTLVRNRPSASARAQSLFGEIAAHFESDQGASLLEKARAFWKTQDTPASPPPPSSSSGIRGNTPEMLVQDEATEIENDEDEDGDEEGVPGILVVPSGGTYVPHARQIGNFLIVGADRPD